MAHPCTPGLWHRGQYWLLGPFHGLASALPSPGIPTVLMSQLTPLGLGDVAAVLGRGIIPRGRVLPHQVPAQSPAPFPIRSRTPGQPLFQV